MIVHSLGTADRKLLGNGSFVSGHCNCGHFVWCVLLSNAISNAMQFAGCAVLLAVWFCVSKVVFGVGAVILTGMTCGLGVGVLVATGWVACLLWVPGRMIVHSLGTAVCKLLGNGSFVSGHYNWLGVFCLAMPS
jgi:hypothetical protein